MVNVINNSTLPGIVNSGVNEYNLQIPIGNGQADVYNIIPITVVDQI
jgi:hypothetical protein